MKFSLPNICSLLLCITVAANAAADESSPATTARKFVDALQHQQFREAATMFARGPAQDSVATEHILQRIDESLGSFATMHSIPSLPAGKSIKLEVPAHKTNVAKNQKFLQFRYASTASDRHPVFYELNLTADDTPPRVLSFGVHFPSSDAQLTARANQLIRLIYR